MKLTSTLLAMAIVLFSFSASSAEVSCQEQAEAAAIAKEKELNKQDKYQAKDTSKKTDSKTEETYSTEVYNSKGGFVPYEIVVKKTGCKILSVKATTL